MRVIAFSLCLLGLSLQASANNEDYVYAGFHAGASGAVDDNFRGTAASTLDLLADKKLGAVGGMYVGRNHNKWRYELEYALRGNAFDSVFVNSADTLNVAGGLVDSGGSQRTHSLITNVHYNFATVGGWKAFAGGGLGFSFVELDTVTVDGAFFTDRRNWEPSGQVMLQVSRALGGIELGFGFKHFRTTRSKFRTPAGDASYRFVNNEVFARISWKIGEKAQERPQRQVRRPQAIAQPAPAAEPRPAPAVLEPTPTPEVAPKLPGPFMVFFDFDKSNLSADARSIIERAVTAFREGGAARISATGHADRAGTERYNQALALRRAQAVRDALLAQGVPARAISIRSLGETSPLVPTEDGVREWQNRRVEIVISR